MNLNTGIIHNVAQQFLKIGFYESNKPGPLEEIRQKSRAKIERANYKRSPRGGGYRGGKGGREGRG